MSKVLMFLAVIAVAVATSVYVDAHVQCIPLVHACVVH